jgi:TRAP-type mannitol/chloroaromatic compound transport system permease small subunit
VTAGLERTAAALDAVVRRIGLTARWAALAMVLVQFAVVVLRYVFATSWIWLQELILYFHAALFMLGAAYTLLVDQHVRVDVFYARLGEKGRAWIDLLGTLFLLIPACVVIIAFSWTFARRSWAILEGPISVGGIPASFLLKTLVTLFALLLLVQGVSLALKCVVRLRA